MKNGGSGKVVYRKDYTPYPWTLDWVKLRFEIGDNTTRVLSKLQFSRDGAGADCADIELDGQELELISIAMDGKVLSQGEYSQSTEKLIVHGAPRQCLLDIEVLIRPYENTALEGLYPSGNFLLTQCEAEGFRKITYFPDRPDVMTRFDVTVVADAPPAVEITFPELEWCPAKGSPSPSHSPKPSKSPTPSPSASETTAPPTSAPSSSRQTPTTTMSP